MKKTNPTNKTKGLFGFLTTLALAIGVGVSLAPREVVKISAATATTKVTLPDNGTDHSTAFDTSTISTGITGKTPSVGLKDAINGEFITSTVSTANVYAGSTGFKFGSSKNRGSWRFKTQETVTKVEAVFKSWSGDTSQGKITSHQSPSKSITSGNLPTSETTVVLADTSSNEFSIDITGKRGFLLSLEFTYEMPVLRSLESIEVTKQPSKKDYYVGDTFDKSDMEVTAYYDDDTEELVSNDDVTITPNVMSIGVTSVEVDYQGEKATISGISVEPAPTVEFLEVTGSLVKSEYTEGTTFDPTGLVVTAHLSNDTTLDVTSLAIYSPNPLTMGTTEVTISYGGKSASVSVTVTEFVAQVGVYTMKSNTSTYNADPGLDKFDVTKTNPDQEIFVLGDKENLRVGASPNVTEIMLGGTSAAGKVSLTMPAGVYVTAITLHELQVADGALTVNANGGTNVSLSNNSTLESLVFNVYTNKVTLNTSRRLWINSISIETALVNGAAEHYSNLFLDGTHEECLAGSVKESTWDALGDIFIGMDWAVIEQFDGVAANAEGSILEQYIARYTYIGEKYGYDDFMDLGFIQASTDRTVNRISDNSNLITVTVLIGVIGLTTLAGYYFLQKKKVA